MIRRYRHIFSGLLATSMLTPALAAAQGQQQTRPTEQQANQATSSQEIEEIVVRGAYIPEPKRDSSQVSSFITREDFARTGDDDVSASLSRMTGVKLNRGKFVFIRGLGERFASVVLNGIELPSPEPLRRVAPLDIFPTELLEGVTVQKTFSPQYNGDFGGGLVNLETRATPTESFFSVSGEIGVDTQTTFRNSLKVDGGDLDFLGINDGIRDLTPPLKDALLSGKPINRSNFSDTELQNIARSFPNSELSVLFEGDAPVNTEFNAAYGKPFKVGGANVGLFLVGNFTSDWENRKGKRQSGRLSGLEEDSPLELRDDFDLFGTQLDTRWSGLGSLGVDWSDGIGEHTLKFTKLYIKSTTKENRRISGFSDTEGQIQQRDFIEWFDRELFTIQAAGEHFLFGDALEVKWNFGYSEASRDEPFRREFGFLERNGELIFDVQGGVDHFVSFSTVADDVLAGGVQGRYNFSLSDSVSGSFYAGWDGSETDRDAARRELTFLNRGVPDELLRRRIDFIFADQNINPNRFELFDVTGQQFDPNYIGSLIVNGYFVGSEFDLGPFVNIDAGVRVEDGEQIVDTFSPFEPNQGVEAIIDGTDVLPTVSVNWTFAENMQLRGAFSQTIGRPQFRELAPSPFINVETDQTFVGNPGLTNPRLDNFDLRWEWYFARNQFLTLGFFYKNVDDPIEQFVETAGGGGDSTTIRFQQIPQARIKGVEFELNRRFTVGDGFLGLGDLFSSGEFLIAMNYTLTDSEIVVDEGDVLIRPTPAGGGVVEVPAIGNLRDGRALQGQADHILNVQLAYEDPIAETQVALLYNFTSERIRELGRVEGGIDLPPVLARDPASLDFRYTQGFDFFGQPLRAAFSARNILGDDFRAVQRRGESKILVDTFQVGRSLSLSIEARF